MTIKDHLKVVTRFRIQKFTLIVAVIASLASLHDLRSLTTTEMKSLGRPTCSISVILCAVVGYLVIMAEIFLNFYAC